MSPADTAQDRPSWFARTARRALPFVLGAGAFAVAGVHTVAVAEWAGQPVWAAVVVTGTGEAMAVAAVLEVRHRRRTGAGLFWPVLVTIAAFGFSAACNLTAALVRTHDGHLVGHPGMWRPVMAVWPVIAFALVTLMKATGGHGDEPTAPAESTEPGPVAPESAPAVALVPVAAPTEPAGGEPDASEPAQRAVPAPRADGSRASQTRGSRASRGAGARDGGSRGAQAAQRRRDVARLYAALPADDGRSMRQLADDFGAQLDLPAATVRRYLAEFRQTDGPDVGDVADAAVAEAAAVGAS